MLMFLLSWPLALLAQSSPAPEETPVARGPNQVRVVYLNRWPYSFNTPEGPKGASIDVLNLIAAQNNWSISFQQANTQEQVVTRLVSNAADMAVGGLTITMDRTLFLDFGHVYQIVPLQMVVRDSTGKMEVFRHLMLGLINPAMLNILALGIGVTVLAGWLISRLESGQNPDIFPPSFHENVWWSGQTLVAHNCGARVPRSHRGRTIAMFLMFGGTIFTAQITALLTTNLSRSLEANAPITGPSDISGRLVGTVKDTYALEWLVGNLITAQGYPTLDDALNALERGEVSAVVFDSYALIPAMAQRTDSHLRLIGSHFGVHPHAILMQKDSPYRSAVNTSISHLIENGSLDDITQRWLTVRYPRQQQSAN